MIGYQQVYNGAHSSIGSRLGVHAEGRVNISGRERGNRGHTISAITTQVSERAQADIQVVDRAGALEGYLCRLNDES